MSNPIKNSKISNQKNHPHLPHIPNDIIPNIFSHLPVKTLLRFKCVCKEWHSLISTQEFINLHLKQSLKTNSNNLLILFSNYSLSFIELDVPGHCNKPQRIILNDPHPHDRFYRNRGAPTVVGSCNGLLCVLHYGIYLYNPSTGFRATVQGSTGDYLGFGYDSVGNDYKIISMKLRLPLPMLDLDDNVPLNVGLDTHVFSLRGNAWKKGPAFDHVLAGNQKHAKFTNNALHWLVKKGDLGELGIVAFELHDETYSMLSLPDLGASEDHEFGLWVLGGELCLQVEYCVLGKYNIDVWVMKEYGVQESWTKLFRFPYEDVLGSRTSMKALAYSKGGRKVLLEQDSKYYWHEVKGKMMSASLGVSGCFALEVCVGSLVSLAEFGHAGDEIQKQKQKRDEQKTEVENGSTNDLEDID